MLKSQTLRHFKLKCLKLSPTNCPALAIYPLSFLLRCCRLDKWPVVAPRPTSLLSRPLNQPCFLSIVISQYVWLLIGVLVLCSALIVQEVFWYKILTLSSQTWSFRWEGEIMLFRNSRSHNICPSVWLFFTKLFPKLSLKLFLMP